MFTASKDYSIDKGQDKFKLISEGATITKGELYTYFETILS